MELVTSPIMQWVAGELLPTALDASEMMLAHAQKIVGGYVEHITFYDADGLNGIQFLMNDNGINEMLPVNNAFSAWFAETYPLRVRANPPTFYGNIIILTGNSLWV